ncbi:MAG: hypothetical protein M1831_005017 [Alyxoria varia]|nr:MAG: hypothetical protein M1831_005017 [Alyxoria varia]
MRVRLRTIRSALLLLLSLEHTTSALHTDVSKSLQRRDATPETDGSYSTPQTSNVGTKDAPVDGQDGKPHAGPFVDSSSRKKDSVAGDSASSKRKSRSEKMEVEDEASDDEFSRKSEKAAPETEAGVSEKSRSKEAHESETGKEKYQKPKSPKDTAQVPSVDDDELPSKPKSYPIPSKPKTKEPADSDDESEKEAPHDSPNDNWPLTDSDDSDGAHDLIRWDSLFGSFSSIAATEIGDKTFIVAALMAMRHPRLQVFTAAFSALFVMTILSGVTGHAVGALISKRWAAVVAAILFFVFGAKSLKEGFDMDENQGVGDEMREVQAELEEKEVDMARQQQKKGSFAPANGKVMSELSPETLESGRAAEDDRSRSRSRVAPSLKRSPSASFSPSPSRGFKPRVANPNGGFMSVVNAVASGVKNLLTLVLSPAWVETFSMTFVGELGDRSQIATVAMAAGQEYFWIMVGATLGHFVCTAGAVLGGSVLAGRITMRKVTLIGGGIFIAFGLFTFLEAIQYFR